MLSRRTFTACLPAGLAGLLPASLRAAVRGSEPPPTPPRDLGPIVAVEPEPAGPLPLEDFAAALTAAYQFWWALAPEWRTASSLIQNVSRHLLQQWRRIQADRLVHDDADLHRFAQEHGLAHTLRSIRAAALDSGLHVYGPIDDSPLATVVPAVDGAFLQVKLPATRRFKLHHRCIVDDLVFAGADHEIAAKRAVLPIEPWREGTPADRFGVGLALLLHELAAALPPAATVGDVHLNLHVHVGYVDYFFLAEAEFEPQLHARLYTTFLPEPKGGLPA